MNTLNIQLTDELRRYVDGRATDSDVYATPSEYIRDLIRRDRERQIVHDVRQGMTEVRAGNMVKRRISDVINED